MNSFIKILFLAMSLCVCASCKDEKIDPVAVNCPSCPTITSVSPSIGFAGDSVQITGTSFKDVKAVYFGDKSVEFTLSGNTIFAEVPAPVAGQEKASVPVSIEIANPIKPTETIHSNVKGQFKYAELVVERYAGKGRIGNENQYSSFLNIPKADIPISSPTELTIDTSGNLYYIQHKPNSKYSSPYINKIDSKTGLVSTILNPEQLEQMIFIGSRTFVRSAITIDNNQNLYVAYTVGNNSSDQSCGILRLPLNTLNVAPLTMYTTNKLGNSIEDIGFDPSTKHIYIVEYDWNAHLTTVKKLVYPVQSILELPYFFGSFAFKNNDIVCSSNDKTLWYPPQGSPVVVLKNNSSQPAIDTRGRLMFYAGQKFTFLPNYKNIDNQNIFCAYNNELYASYPSNVVQANETTYYTLSDYQVLKISLK